VAIDAEGRIWVTDTGHDRLVVYSPGGEFIREVGREGSGRGEFNEPVGIAYFQGSLFIADMYNSRLVILDGEGNWQSEFRVDGWGGQLAEDKPYLRPLRDGRVAVSLPGLNQVRIYTRTGTLTATLNGGDEPLNRPYGLLETADGKLWIVEGGASRVRQFDLPR
jgi:DNA-binding beta-propeller fold protein YncE